MTPFSSLVGIVVSLSAKEEVRRIDTVSDITSMQNEHPFWDRPVPKFVGNAMCAETVGCWRTGTNAAMTTRSLTIR